MLVNGDCLEEVQKLVDKGVQVDSIVTDPPYHLTSIVERFGKDKYRRDLVKFVDEYDSRRKTNFLETFPQFKEIYAEYK